MMIWQVEDAKQELANQKMAMSDSMDVRAGYDCEKLSGHADDLPDPAGLCPGRAVHTCHSWPGHKLHSVLQPVLHVWPGEAAVWGEQDSKWVVDSLIVVGHYQERSLVRTELNLTKHINSTDCRRVILALAAVDSQAGV